MCWYILCEVLLRRPSQLVRAEWARNESTTVCFPVGEITLRLVVFGTHVGYMAEELDYDVGLPE